jgi:hypothetical protein
MKSRDETEETEERRKKRKGTRRRKRGERESGGGGGGGGRERTGRGKRRGKRGKRGEERGERERGPGVGRGVFDFVGLFQSVLIHKRVVENLLANQQQGVREGVRGEGGGRSTRSGVRWRRR